MSVALIIGLAVLGMVLMALEVFVIPGFGISGVLGLASLILAVALAADSPVEVLIYSVIALGFIGALGYIGFKTNILSQKFFLATRQVKTDGYVAPQPDLTQYIGRIGVSLSPLRPAGKADFQGERLDVVTEGGWIPQGRSIKVVAVEGVRIIVREESGNARR